MAPAKGRRKRDLIEASPTGRAKCQNCGELIEKGATRVGIQGQIMTGRGIPVWSLRYYHEGCVSENTKRKLHLGPRTPPAKRAKRSVVSPDRKNTNNRGSLLTPRVRKQLELDLRRLRSQFASYQNCDPWRIFPNKSLSEILARLPRDEQELVACWGIKEKRLRQYGGAILAVVGSYLSDEGIHQTTSNSIGCILKAKPGTPTRGGTEGASSAVSPSGIEGSADDDIEVQSGPTLSVEEIVARRVREAKARGEVFEIP